MFNTLGSFSIVYFALAAVLFVLILFEKQFIHLEEKYNAKKTKARKTAKHMTAKKVPQGNRHNTVNVKQNKSTGYRRTSGTAA